MARRRRRAKRSGTGRRGRGNTISARVTSFAWQRGLHTGSRAWLYFGAGMQGVRLLGRVTSSKPEIYRLKLRPGDAIEIREVPRVQ